MNDLQVLKELLRTNSVIDIRDKKATLVEPKTKDHKGYSVSINGIPEDSIILKVDDFPTPKPIFNNLKGECKRADFVIITSDSMIFIELQKSNNKLSLEIIQQLKGAQCFIDYCRSIGKEFWGKSDFLKIDKQYFVSIKNIGISKRPTREPVNGANTSPENMLKIGSPHHLEFGGLIVK